jgi:hypothetical protein
VQPLDHRETDRKRERQKHQQDIRSSAHPEKCHGSTIDFDGHELNQPSQERPRRPDSLLAAVWWPAKLAKGQKAAASGPAKPSLLGSEPNPAGVGSSPPPAGRSVPTLRNTSAAAPKRRPSTLPVAFGTSSPPPAR